MAANLEEQLALLREDPLLASVARISSTPAYTPVSGSVSQRQFLAADSSSIDPHHSALAIQTLSATALLQAKTHAVRFSSGSPGLDALIATGDDDAGGSLSAGQVLELTGCPGEGKTRLCLSYALQACLSSPEDGPERGPRVLIIDTQGGLGLSALHQGALELCQGDTGRAATLLDRMQLWPCTETDDILAALYHVSNHVQAHPSIRLVIIDSLSSALHAHVVPALSSSVYSNLEASKENRRNSTSKRRRTTAKLDPKVEANHSIIRQLLSTAVKETLLNLSTRNVAAIVTTQSKTKLTDEFGEHTTLKDARHSFAVQHFTNFWHPPYATQILLSAGKTGVRVATVTVCPGTSKKGQGALFRTTPSGVRDG